MLNEQPYFPSEFVGFKALQKERNVFVFMQSSDVGNPFSVLSLFYIYRLFYFTLLMWYKL